MKNKSFQHFKNSTLDTNMVLSCKCPSLNSVEQKVAIS